MMHEIELCSLLSHLKRILIERFEKKNESDIPVASQMISYYASLMLSAARELHCNRRWHVCIYARNAISCYTT
jgi:hypothetical protein